MAKRDIILKVEGVDELELMLRDLGPTLHKNLQKGFDSYVRKHLVPRMKERLAQATQPMAKSTPGKMGKPGGGGGYGVPKNASKYAEWKRSRSNLPLVGGLSPRELVATGHFIESINVTNFTKGKDFFSYAVGPRPGKRPHAKPFSDDPPGTADVSEMVENSEIAEWIEDSKYAWLVTEFEDVKRDITPLVMRILHKTIIELYRKYMRTMGKKRG